MSTETATERIDTVVIGAGQGGLSAGFHLAQRGLPFVILDADARIGDHWRERWDSLKLYSPAKYDSLPGMPFPGKAFHWPTGREMGDYLEAYARHHDLPVRSGIRVQRVDPVDAGFLVTTADDQRIAARQVVVASGPFRRPYVPDFARHSTRGSGSSTRTSTATRASCRTGRCSSSGCRTPVPTSPTSWRTPATRTILSGKAKGQMPFRVTDIAEGVGSAGRSSSSCSPMSSRSGRRWAARCAPHVRQGGGPLLRVRLPDLDRAGVERHDARTVGVRDGKPESSPTAPCSMSRTSSGHRLPPDYAFDQRAGHGPGRLARGGPRREPDDPGAVLPRSPVPATRSRRCSSPAPDEMREVRRRPDRRAGAAAGTESAR